MIKVFLRIREILAKYPKRTLEGYRKIKMNNCITQKNIIISKLFKSS